MFEFFQSAPILSKLIVTGCVIFIGMVLSVIFHWSIGIFFTKIQSSSKHMISKTSTVRSLLNSIVDVIIFSMVIFVILSHWGINIIPLLTGAGVAGLAISFGAQTLVKDLISGFFIIVEDQYNIGDVIKVGDYEGAVRMITLRLTVLKDKKGNLIYIPNSQVTTVVKYEEN